MCSAVPEAAVCAAKSSFSRLAIVCSEMSQNSHKKRSLDGGKEVDVCWGVQAAGEVGRNDLEVRGGGFDEVDDGYLCRLILYATAAGDKRLASGIICLVVLMLKCIVTCAFC